MDAQNVFYVLGSIFMLFGIVVLIAVTVALVSLVKTIKKLRNDLNEKIATVKSFTSQPAVIARGLGSFAAGIMSFGFKQIFKKKHKPA